MPLKKADDFGEGINVWQDILEDLGIPQSNLFTMDQKPPRCVDYVRDKVFAIDFDEKSVRVARCLNLIAGDGQTNVLHLNTLDYKRWEETVKEEEWQDTYGPGWTKLKKLMVTRGDYRSFKFDVLMANPPFAGDVKQSDMLAPYELGHKENGKQESAVGRDLLFIERNLDFLKPGGRMAVVLPQGRFNNATDKRVREYIAEHCRILGVVGLHPNTFKPHTGTKTSVLLVQKWNDDPSAGELCPKVDDYNIFFATQRLASKDNSGDKILTWQKFVRWIDTTIPGHQTEDIGLAKFRAQYGDPDEVSEYIVTYPDNTQKVCSRAWITAEYGSLRALETQEFHRVEPLKIAHVYQRPARDNHGHWVWQHDLFSTGGNRGGVY
jgi:type I restriction enzyme M protein